MKLRQRRRLLLGSLASLLVLLLVVMYVQSSAFDESHYFSDVATLNQVRHLDAGLDLDILKSRVGRNPHYDGLAFSLSELARIAAELTDHPHDGAYENHELIDRARRELARAMRQKAALIERFKSANSLMQNSLALIPTVALQTQEALAASAAPHSAAGRVSGTVQSLLLQIVLTGQGESDIGGPDMAKALAGLEADSGELAPAARERLDIFIAHLRTLQREQVAVNALLVKIEGVATSARVDLIDKLLTQEEQRADAIQARTRAVLVAMLVALLALLSYAALRLTRSHLEIGRVNGALNEANEHLEKRVHERTAELHAMQTELVGTARRAGMAEIASNVLHNVGNILNSVNVSAEVVRTTIQKNRVKGLARAVELLELHQGNLGAYLEADEKGKLLPAYLKALSGELAQEQQAIVQELHHLARSVEHIKEVVATQQSYAGGTTVVEPAQIANLVEDALRMNQEGLDRNGVRIARQFAPTPDASLDRSRVLQILVNLISNAKNAMAEMPEHSRNLTVRVESNESRLRVAVEDTGDGIAPDNLTKVFIHGFTTRKSGHGFGLHSCALAARQMGGTLQACSEGVGKGAVFTLELPLGAPA